ncbi:MAG: RNA ligase [Myxococcota bacterium]
MKISLNDIDREMFFVRPSVEPRLGELVQISPRMGKHRWTSDELHLRSLLCRPDGTVISTGFPKFFNFGEDQTHDRLTREAVERGVAWFTEKMDGSLLIRDVIDGVAHVRTRGSANLPDNPLGHRIQQLITRQYPALLDPAVLPGRSLLFEYTSNHPDDRIIVRYPEQKLTALGWMDVDTLCFSGTSRSLDEMAKATGAAAVKRYPLPTSMDAVLADVRGWGDREGIVVRSPLIDGNTLLIKIKALRYLKSHMVRYHFSPQRMARFCWAADIRDIATLRQEFFTRGIDWEVLEFLRADFEAYQASLASAEAAVASFLDAVAEEGLLGRPMAEVVGALRALGQSQPSWSRLFALGAEAIKHGPDAAEVAATPFVGALVLGAKVQYARALRADGEIRATALEITPGLSAR